MVMMVSIPLWCDCDGADPQTCSYFAQVSIPLWCDCDFACADSDDDLIKFGFNPTMVRLRPTMPQCHNVTNYNVSIPLWCDCDVAHCIVALLHCGIGFNPTMVRLRQALSVSFVTTPTTFQSHYGAIATDEDYRGQGQTDESFNPTMVRLRP